MEKVFIDTSGWVALFIANDQYHEKAVSIIKDLKKIKAQLFTSDYIIDETVTTILGRSNHKQSVLAGEYIINSKILQIITVYAEYFQPAWKRYKHYKDKEFSLTDVTSFTIMKTLNIHKSFTFDRDFEQAGFEIVQ